MLNEDGTSPASTSFKRFIIFAVVLSLVFSIQLVQLVRFALHDDFFSYIPLIPVITGYLIWIKRPELPKRTKGSKAGAVALGVLGLAAFGGFLLLRHSTAGTVPTEDYLCFMTMTYLFFLVAGTLAFFGATFCWALFFPLVFLVFMIPMPTVALDWMEAFFQQTSAVTASGMLQGAGMAVLRDGLILHLPGFSIMVAPECSGIHSTMVLLMTSLLAGYLFLRSTWKQILLVLVVVPLAILRNGFRIFVISELCVRINHNMIDSPIHRQGGPIFFALSLIPFFFLLMYLRKSDFPRSKSVDNTRTVKV